MWTPNPQITNTFPPSTAPTAGAIGLIFGLRDHWLIISGATVAIFEFPGALFWGFQMKIRKSLRRRLL